MRRYDAVLFDLDGTLLDTLKDLYLAYRETMRRFGYPEHTMDEVRMFVGNGLRKLCERSLPKGEADPRFEEVFQYLRTYYRAHAKDYAVPYAGIVSLMEKLKREGYRLAVLSNKPDADVIALCEEHFHGLGEIYRGARDGTALKPDPGAVYSVLNDMNIPKEKAVYVGDSEVDLKTAANAGIPCITVSWGFRSPEALKKAGAKIITDNTEELYCAIEQGEPYEDK